MGFSTLQENGIHMLQDITNNNGQLCNWNDEPAMIYSPHLKMAYDKLSNNIAPLPLLHHGQHDLGPIHYMHMDRSGLIIREYISLKIDQHCAIQGAQLLTLPRHQRLFSDDSQHIVEASRLDNDA